MTYLDRFDELLERPVGTRSIAVVRAGVGLVALWFLWPFARDAWRGSTYHDRFHEPFLDALPHPSPTAFTVLVTVGVIGAAAMTVGLASRIATVATTVATGTYLVASTTHLHNNRAYLLAVLVGLSLAPSGRSFSVDRLVRRRLGHDELDETMPGWPLWLLRFECSLVYAASGFSKLVDPDWFGGTVTWGRVTLGEAMIRDSILPTGIQDLLLERSFHSVAAKVIVLTELFIAGGLWWRRSRPVAVVVAVAFHVSIEVSAQVQSFSYLAVIVLIVWADPDLRYSIARRGVPRVSA